MQPGAIGLGRSVWSAMRTDFTEPGQGPSAIRFAADYVRGLGGFAAETAALRSHLALASFPSRRRITGGPNPRCLSTAPPSVCLVFERRAVLPETARLCTPRLCLGHLSRLIGETGFEPATARPPAGGQVCQMRPYASPASLLSPALGHIGRGDRYPKRYHPILTRLSATHRVQDLGRDADTLHEVSVRPSRPCLRPDCGVGSSCGRRRGAI